MFSCFSYRVLFQRFFTQNISLLPKIVTEAHANLKKKKKLQHYLEALCCHGQVHPFGTFESIFQSYLLAGSIFFHLFIISSSSKFIWVVVHYCIVHFLRALYHFMN